MPTLTVFLARKNIGHPVHCRLLNDNLILVSAIAADIIYLLCLFL